MSFEVPRRRKQLATRLAGVRPLPRMRSHRPEHNHHLFIKVFTSRLVRMAQGMHSQRSVVRESLTAIHTDVWLTPPHLHFMATHVRSQ
jgi:hypothetical protein